VAQEMTSPPPATARGATKWLRRAFFFAVAAFAWWRFSENTADNDLWGHVLYGQRMLHLGAIEMRETLSWTAAGLPWINHEVLAEVVMGLAHQLAGGTGLWILMMGLASITLGLAWHAGAGTDRTRRLIAAALLALSTNSIALGYSMRPQLFTYLFLVILLLALRCLFSTRSVRWAFVLPLLLALWANTHGGFLAGWLIVMVTVTVEVVGSFRPTLLRRLRCEPAGLKPLLLVNIALGSTLALAANPWGLKLVQWTFETIRLPRPDIYEWRPMPLALASAPFFSVLLLGALAWAISRQPRRLWEMAVWVMLGLMAIQHQRHAPLFGLASLVLLPVHLQDLLTRLAAGTVALRAAIQRPAIAVVSALVLLASGSWCLQASRSVPRQYPFRMEVPRALFPVSAIEYMRAHDLTGNTFTFFDWGQQVLWELPDNPVSFDGRLDTVYPKEIMDAHWRLYAGEDPGLDLPLLYAKYALLPTGSRSVILLASKGWSVLYEDPLATVLTSRPHPPAKLSLSFEASRQAVSGSVPFPDAPPVLATRATSLEVP
jgi:hypothetical protein